MDNKSSVELGIWPIFKPFMPWTWEIFKKAPAPEPAGTPKTQAVAYVKPWADKPAIALSPQDVVAPTEVAKLIPEYGYAIAPTAFAAPPPQKSFFEEVWQTLEWPVETFLKYQQSKQAMEYGMKLAEMEAESYKAAQAIAEAQARAAQQQAETEKYRQDWRRYLSAEAVKKAAPYLLPIAIGITAVVLLTARKKKEEE